ncbi:MAG TPA: glycine--tRNA ligase subunit beta [Candidatus Krumholzibacteria bacterium]|nr:glycine--tRNA ligase subunit beta [Candidatus Krumholzibacteria bacterium]
MSDFVLEIGVENLPASYIPPAVAQLRDDARALFARNRLVYEQIDTAGTPRRLVLTVTGLADRQDAGEEVLTGPPVARAFQDDGTPTPAAEGFARTQGVAVAKLERIQLPKGEYLGLRKRLARKTAAVVLKAELPGLIAGLRFPKTMKWEASGARFARPVRWIVALHGREVVPVAFAGVTSGRVCHGRPWMRGEHVSVADARSYPGRLKSLGVILDPDARRERIRSLAVAAAAKNGLRLVEDEDLLVELTYMTEDPRVLVGSFDRAYLDLPADVVVTAMRAHQRYIALTDRKGGLSPHFITFTDGPVKGPKDVVLGNERVLRARLADAGFYWRDDLKRGVDTLADELDRIVFIEGLGTVGQKWRRMLEVARAVNDAAPAGERVPDELLTRAVRLAKSDLASTMIRDGKEFTALQGVIGARYAEASGEAPAVVDAIAEQYLPRAAADPLPATPLGRILALADRIDTLVGCFLAGLKPSGSQDPYALRRSGNGLVRLAAVMPGVRLDQILAAASASFGITLSPEEVEKRWTAGGTGAELEEFLRGRVEAFLKDSGVPYDVAAAVMAVAWSEPGTALVRARAIAELRGNPVFERLVTGVKRVGNILPAGRRRLGHAWSEVRDGLGVEAAFSADRFEDAAETGLLEAVREGLGRIGPAEDAGDIAKVLRSLSGLADPIDHYFEKVLVNAQDPAVRENRLAFMAAIYGLFGRYADFQAIVEQGTRS